VLEANPQEAAAHQARLDAIKKNSGHCLWNDL